MSDEPMTFTGLLRNGTLVLVTVYDGEEAELAFRPISSSSWGPPIPLTRSES